MKISEFALEMKATQEEVDELVSYFKRTFNPSSVWDGVIEDFNGTDEDDVEAVLKEVASKPVWVFMTRLRVIENPGIWLGELRMQLVDKMRRRS
jgi:hypothetical protein